jgi:hypothetical protein
VVLALVCTSGCTTLKPVPFAASASPFEDLTVAQRVRVLDRQGISADIVLTAVEPDFIEGRTKQGAVLRFGADDIDELRRRQRAPGKTAALVSLSVVYVLGVVAAAEVSLLAVGL